MSVPNNKLFVDGALFAEFTKVWNLDCDGNLDIGSFSDKGNQVFQGKIYYV